MDSISRHEHWRVQYRVDRYMVGLSDAELDLRFADVLSNTTVLTSDGKIGVGGMEWMEKGTHLQEEYALRGRGLPPADTIRRRLRVPGTARNEELISAIRSDYPRGIPDQFTLFKYGERKYLVDFVTGGKLRLAPASVYSDPSLNPAIEDQELELEKIHGAERKLYKSRTNYYCYCSAIVHSDRLIEDFNADCIVVITDPAAFFLRLAEVLDEKEYDLSFKAVQYIDPLLLKEHDVNDLRFVKHMRFAYQFEHRFVAVPPVPILDLDFRFLDLGSLEDIATIYGV